MTSEEYQSGWISVNPIHSFRRRRRSARDSPSYSSSGLTFLGRAANRPYRRTPPSTRLDCSRTGRSYQQVGLACGIRNYSADAVPAVRRPVIEVGLILIQYGSSAARPQDCRLSSVSRWISSSDSTNSVNPLTTTLHPEWACAL